MRYILPSLCNILRSWTVLPSGLWSSTNSLFLRVSLRFLKFKHSS